MRLLLLLTTLTAACGTSVGAAASPDAASAPDGGSATDAGISAQDAATALDAAPSAEDAGALATDAGHHCPEGYPMDDLAGKPVVEVLINGTGPYRFVYDTGAPTSGIDFTLGPKIGAGPYSVEIGGRHFDVPRFDRYDVRGGLRSMTIVASSGT